MVFNIRIAENAVLRTLSSTIAGKCRVPNAFQIQTVGMLIMFIYIRAYLTFFSGKHLASYLCI